MAAAAPAIRASATGARSSRCRRCSCSRGEPRRRRACRGRANGRPRTGSRGAHSERRWCGWPEKDCKCSSRSASEAVPSRPEKIVAKLRLEKKGRSGKTVTVVAGLPHNADFLKQLCQDLKRACGTGGAVSEDTIELQRDL